MSTEICEVIIAADDAAWLAHFTRSLVDDRLVACGQNIAPIRSIYRWEGKVHDDIQARVALHTRASLVPKILERADRDHPDDVPCVLALPVQDGNPAYVEWVMNETTNPPTQSDDGEEWDPGGPADPRERKRELAEKLRGDSRSVTGGAGSESHPGPGSAAGHTL